MNRKVILAVALFALSLGGAGGAYYFMAGAKKPEPAHVEAPPPPPPPVFIAVDPLNVPLWKGDRVAGFYFVAVNLQVDDEAARQRVNGEMPRLRDAFLVDVNSHPMVRKDDPGSIDFEMLKNRLKAIADKVMGKGVVKDVLIVRAMRTMG